MNKTLFVTCLLVFAVIGGCNAKDEPKKVSLEKRETVAAPSGKDSGKHIRIAVGGMITPKEGLAYYRNFLDYLGEKLGRKVEFVDREDYSEINDMLRAGNLEAAFVCSGPYVDGHREFGLELLAVPQAYGGTVYYSYIIVAKKSPINRFDDLRGRTFAFTDPLSNTGKLVPTYMLARMGETPKGFFKKYTFTYHHDKSIKAVAHGVVDGAAVDSLIWEYLDRTNPEFTSKTRIISKSPPYAIPPLVVPANMAPELKGRLKQIVLNAHNDEKGRALLSKMMIDKFVEINDSAYDSIREMKAWLDKPQAMAQGKK